MRKIKKLVAVCVAIGMMMNINICSFAASWKQDATGWWWQNDDETWPVNQWKEINGKWYYFGADGYMLSNTTTPGGYYVDASGAWIQDTNTDSAIPWITPSNTDGFEMSEDWPDYRWRWKNESGNYYSNCWVNFPGSNCWIYFGTEGYSLIDTDTPDGYHVDSNGVYYAPQYNESGKRNLIAGDVLSNNIQSLEERVDVNGNKYYLISSDTTSISFEYMDNIDENALILDFAAYTYSPQTNTINVFSNDGTAVYEDFQFGRVYNFKLEGVNATGSALVEYCKQNDIIIRVDVSNRIDGVGVSFLYCYE